MDMTVEGSRNLLAEYNLQLVSRVCGLVGVDRWVIIFLRGYTPFFTEWVSVV